MIMETRRTDGGNEDGMDKQTMWRAAKDQSGYWEVRDSRGKKIAAVAPGHYLDAPIPVDDKANEARLIAAAPELLAALEDCAARLGRNVPAGTIALIRRIKN